MLENLEKLKKDAGGVHAALYEADGSVLERLKMMAAVLAELSELDANLKPVADEHARRDDRSWKRSRSTCPATSTSSTSTPASWPRSNDRLNTHQPHPEQVRRPGRRRRSRTARRSATKIAELERATDDLASLEQRARSRCCSELKQLGEELSAKRQAVGEEARRR